MSQHAPDIERCTQCTIPITWETVHFDEKGVCNICNNWGTKKNEIDWAERERQFVELIEPIKQQKNDYDCIVPFSGGKDSTYTLYTLVRKFGLKPLVVSFDHSFMRPTVLKNRLSTFRKLGVDVLTFTPNWNLVKRMMLESLIRRGDSCWHCHSGIFAYPMQVAVKYKIPLIIWGEGGGEYEAYFKYADLEETDEWKFNRRLVLGIRAEDMAGFLDVELRDLSPYVYPAKSELEEVGVKSVPLGNFIPWDVKKHVEVIQQELDWELEEVESAFPGPTYEKIECVMQGFRDYAKYLKRGFSRITHLTSLDIRHGRMDREEALKHIQALEYKKPRSLEVILEYMGISEAEFNDIILKHVIHPAEPIDPEAIPYGEKLWDQEQWYREASSKPLTEAEVP